VLAGITGTLNVTGLSNLNSLVVFWKHYTWKFVATNSTMSALILTNGM
jgi:hypothetical protein